MQKLLSLFKRPDLDTIVASVDRAIDQLEALATSENDIVNVLDQKISDLTVERREKLDLVHRTKRIAERLRNLTV